MTATAFVADTTDTTVIPDPLRPEPQDIIASTVTLHDFFPKTTELNLERGSARPFTVVARRSANGKLLDPDLLVVTRDGNLHRYVPSANRDGGWSKEPAPFPIAELDGRKVNRISASIMHAGTAEERLHAVVTGTAKDGSSVFALLERAGGNEWQRRTLPGGSVPPDVVATGRASSNGFQLHYACSFTARHPALHAYALGVHGQLLACDFAGGLPPRISHLVRLPDTLAIAYLDRAKNVLCFARATAGTPVGNTLPIRIDPAPPMITAIAHRDIGDVDASYLMPITDSEGVSRGMFVTTIDDQLYALELPASGEVQMLRLTNENAADKPRFASDVTYSFDSDELHVYVTDHDSLIWHGRGPLDKTFSNLKWTQTAQSGTDIEAAVFTDEPVVYVDGIEDRIDRISPAAAGERWARDGINVPEPKLDAVPMAVHAITLSAVTSPESGQRALPDVPLLITASYPVVAEYQGALLRLHPKRAAALTTNPAGGVRLRLRCTGLDAPVLTVRSPMLPGLTRELKPNESALRRLSGEGFDVSGPSMIAAQLIPRDTPPASAEETAKTFRQAARLALGMPARRGEAAAGFMILCDGDAPRIASNDEYLAAIFECDSNSAAVATLPSPADFWAWLQRTWDSAKKIVVRIVDDVSRAVQVVVDGAVQFITNAAREIANLFNAVIGKAKALAKDLVDAAKALLDWIKDSVDWKEVFVCKDAVRDFTLATFDELEQLLRADIPGKVSEGIRWVMGRIDGWIDEAKKNATFKGLPPPDGKVTPLMKTFQQQNAKLMLLQHAMPSGKASAVAEAQAMEPDLPAAVAEGVRLLHRDLATLYGKEGEAKANALRELLEKPKTLPEILASDLPALLEALRGLIKLAMTTLDVVQKRIFGFIADLLKAFRELLQTKLSALSGAFSWIGKIYSLAAPSGDSATVLDLGCLLFAAPGAMFHRIVTNKSFVFPERPATMATALSVSRAILARKDDDAASGPIVSDLLKATYRYMAVFYDWATAVWQLARVQIAGIELIFRKAELETGVGLPFAVTIGILICDLAPFAWWGVELAFTHDQQIEAFFKNNPDLIIALVLAVIPIAVIIIPVLVYALDSLKKAWGALSALERQTTLAALQTVFGTVTLLMHSVMLILYALGPGKTDTPKDRTRYIIARSAGIWLQLRRFVQILFPLGHLATKTPKTAPAGLAMMAGVALADAAGYLGYGGLMFYRTAVYPRE